MKILTKYRLFHKYRIGILLIFLMGLFISWFFTAGIYDATLGFNTSSPDIAHRIDEVRKIMLGQVLNYDNYVSGTFRYGMILTPIFICATSLIFIREKRGFFPYAILRGKSEKKLMLKTLLYYGLINGATFYFAYVIFCTVGLLFNSLIMQTPRLSFDFIFGEGFSQNQVYLYYLVEGIFKYFILGFVYTLFSCTIALITNKSYLSILIPIIYYFGASVAFASGFQVMLLAPVFTQGFSSYGDPVPIWGILMPMLVPFLISMGICLSVILRREKQW